MTSVYLLSKPVSDITPADMITEETESKRPNDGAFYQQRLPAWKPVLTVHTVMPIFAVLGVLFIPVGICLFVTSALVEEKYIEYTDCHNAQNLPCYQAAFNSTCVCDITFNLTKPMMGNLYMYYGLRRFYQNHRKYATSRSDKQLRGTPRFNDENCVPYQFDPDTNHPYSPCGLIANSMFNDSFTLYKVSDGYTETRINYTQKEIAWPSDHGIKFQNAEGVDLKKSFVGTEKPSNWYKPAYEWDLKDPSNNGFLNEPFIVWMRVAAFPTFRKVYGRIETLANPELDAGLLPGQYKLSIIYNYPVKYYSSEKFFVLSTTSWMGAKNPLLGVMYLITGTALVILSLVFALLSKHNQVKTKRVGTTCSNVGVSDLDQ